MATYLGTNWIKIDTKNSLNILDTRTNSKFMVEKNLGGIFRRIFTVELYHLIRGPSSKHIRPTVLVCV